MKQDLKVHNLALSNTGLNSSDIISEITNHLMEQIIGRLIAKIIQFNYIYSVLNTIFLCHLINDD